MDFIEAIEKTLDRKADMNMLPMQPGDVPATWADVNELVFDFGYAPSVSVQEGIQRFIQWYKTFYEVS